MACDGKTVGFIANVLNKVQSGHICRQMQLFVALPHDQGLQPRLAGHPLGDAHQQRVFAPQKLQLTGQDLLGAAQLAEAAVDEEHVRHLVRLLLLAKAALLDKQHVRHLVRLLLLAKAPLQRLLHGGVVIAPRDAVDVEAPVFR
ncbi:hypothetical protein D3C76_1345460 [compost metagenome]